MIKNYKKNIRTREIVVITTILICGASYGSVEAAVPIPVLPAEATGFVEIPLSPLLPPISGGGAGAGIIGAIDAAPIAGTAITGTAPVAGASTAVAGTAVSGTAGASVAVGSAAGGAAAGSAVSVGSVGGFTVGAGGSVTGVPIAKILLRPDIPFGGIIVGSGPCPVTTLGVPAWYFLEYDYRLHILIPLVIVPGSRVNMWWAPFFGNATLGTFLPIPGACIFPLSGDRVFLVPFAGTVTPYPLSGIGTSLIPPVIK